MSLWAAVAAHKAAVAGLVGGVVLLGGAAGLAAARTHSDAAERTVVDRVVDGDTIDVLVGGQERRVRLLNIDAPESVAPDAPVECLGPEAAEFLRQRLPEGTVVRLEYDVERTDGYGRDLAGVFRGDELVNAAMAQAGLARPMAIEPNTKFLEQVQRASKEAEERHLGLFSEGIDCTYPSRVAALEQQTSALVAATPDAGIGTGVFDAHDAALAALLAAGADLAAGLGSGDEITDAVLSVDGRSALQARIAAAMASADHARAANTVAKAAEQSRLDEEARKAEAAAEAARGAEDARKAAEAQTPRTGSGSSSPSSGGASGGEISSAQDPAPAAVGYDGYTGCRDYGNKLPDNAIDEKGRPYTKIDCTTKLPIP